MFGKDWLHGPRSDWPFAFVFAPFITTLCAVYMEYTGTPKANSEITTLSAFWTWLGSLDWQANFIETLPIALVLAPIIVVWLRWYRAGEPLPETVTNRSYTGYLVGTTILQALGIGVAWAVWATSALTGNEIATIVEGLPEPVMLAIGALLFLGVTVGMIGPPLCMYLDARYLEHEELLTIFGTQRLLLYIPFVGIQMAGIPTILAVYHYLSKRNVHRVEREVGV